MLKKKLDKDKSKLFRPSMWPVQPIQLNLKKKVNVFEKGSKYKQLKCGYTSVTVILSLGQWLR